MGPLQPTSLTHGPVALRSQIFSAVSGILVKTSRKGYMVLKHFIDPFMSTQSDRASIFKITSLLSWKLANYCRSLLATCLRHQFQCSKALAACINLNAQIRGVLWVKTGFLGDNPVALGIILTFKSKAKTSIPRHPVDHEGYNQFYFVW